MGYMVDLGRGHVEYLATTSPSCRKLQYLLADRFFLLYGVECQIEVRTIILLRLSET